jgi:hypothetical protein
VPDREQTSLFNQGIPSNEVPNEKDPRVDWFFKGDTLWTKGIAEIFATHFITLHEGGKFPLVRPKPSNEWVAEVFSGYIKYLKKGFIAESENPEKAVSQKKKADKRSRSMSRLEQVSRICFQMIRR